MPLASTSAVSLAYLEESAYGVTPITGSPQYLRITGEDLSFDFTTETSKEINNTRQSPDSILTNASASGGFNIELSYNSYDDFLEALLAGTFSTSWDTDGIKSMTVSVLTPENTITDDGVDGFASLPAAPFWMRMVCAATPSLSKAYLVVTKTNDVLTVSPLTPIVVDAAGASVTISHSRLSNGTAAQRSFSIEKVFTDVSQYFMHKGRVPSKLDLNFATGAIVTGTFGFLGSAAPREDYEQFRDAADLGTHVAQGDPLTISAPTSFGMMNAVTGVGSLSILDASTQLVTDTFVNSMKISIDASLREQKGIGTLGAVGIGKGTFKIGGTMEIYLKTGAIYDAALADKRLAVTFPVYDAAGNGYGFVFNNVKLKVPKVVAGSMDADVVLSVEFTAIAPNTATDKMIIIDRFGVAV